MSAIQSLLRVMALRDAEAMVLEAGKVPSFRRRGLVEQLAMDLLEAKWLDDFVAPLIGERPIGEWPSSLPFRDGDGTNYQLTIEKVTNGLRVIVRKGAATASTPAAAKPAAAAPSESKAWWAKPSGSATAATATTVASTTAATAIAPATTAAIEARLTALLSTALAAAREHGASDVLFSTRQTPRMKIDGRLEPLEVAIDDAELAACVGALVGDDGGADSSASRSTASARASTRFITSTAPRSPRA